MEEEISGLEVKIEPMDSSVKDNVKSEKKGHIALRKSGTL